MSSTALIEAESRWWLMPGCQIEVGLMQCGINMWPTVRVCGRLWVQTQTPEARLSANQLRHNRKWSRPHEPTSFQQCQCWAVPLHTDDACSTDHFYLPKEQKQEVILCLFSLLLFLFFSKTFNFSGLLQSWNFFIENPDLKRRSSPPAGPLKVKTSRSKVSIVCTLWQI